MSREYYLEHRLNLIDQAKARYQQKREEIREYWRTLPEDQKQRRREYRRQWAKLNKERKALYDREFFKTLRENPAWRIRFNLAGRLARFVSMRYDNFKTIVGCDAQTLRKHIESQFIGCMSWKNYGKAWHIDHIVPCAAFDLCNPAQARICFNWQNMRPLWAKANLRKGKKILKPQLPLPLILSPD